VRSAIARNVTLDVRDTATVTFSTSHMDNVALDV
jgi:hypothetical protein